jgi:16S rRNA C967 or C1407 C5-methylase (RsmB/RsmF family)
MTVTMNRMLRISCMAMIIIMITTINLICHVPIAASFTNPTSGITTCRTRRRHNDDHYFVGGKNKWRHVVAVELEPHNGITRCYAGRPTSLQGSALQSVTANKDEATTNQTDLYDDEDNDDDDNMLIDIAARALVPVLRTDIDALSLTMDNGVGASPSTNDVSSNSSTSSTLEQGGTEGQGAGAITVTATDIPLTAEKALKKILRKKDRAGTTSLLSSNKNRQRLSQLVLGTSIMKLRHLYVLGHLLQMFSDDSSSSDGDDLLVDCDSDRHTVLAKQLVQLHAQYLRSQQQHGCNNDSITESDDVQKNTLNTNSTTHTHVYWKDSWVSIPWPTSTSKSISVQYSLPHFVATLLINQYGAAEAEKIAWVSNEAGPITFRRNFAAAGAAPSSSEEIFSNLISDVAFCQHVKDADGIQLEPMNMSDQHSNHQNGFPKGCLQYAGPKPKSIWALESWKGGLLEVQDRGSQLIVEATEAGSWYHNDHTTNDNNSNSEEQPVEPFVVVDYCCGNGGKTLAMASRIMRMMAEQTRRQLVHDNNNNTNNGGDEKQQPSTTIIYAHDIVPDRVKQLLGSVERANLSVAVGAVGVDSHTSMHHNTTNPHPTTTTQTRILPVPVVQIVPVMTSSNDIPNDVADLVLVDAPCSSLGVLRRRPSQRWEITQQDIEHTFPTLQLQLLLEAAAKVRPHGGHLVYATCSLAQSENEHVAAAFESMSQEFEPWPFPSNDKDTDDGDGWKNDSNGKSGGPGRNWRAILPHVHNADGFFIARWKRR